MAVPSGIIVGWPSTNGSIPSGWSQESTLVNVFLKIIPNGSTDPGTTGGASTHSHTTSSHTHSTTTHSHTYTGSSGATSTTGSRRNTSGATYAGPTHTHTLPASVNSTAAGTSGGTAPNSDSQSNDPSNLVVSWIKSDGTPAGIPNNALTFFNSDTFPGSWSRYSNSQNRFLKGATSGGDGGGTNAGNSSHTHATAAHSHSVPSHTHTANGVSGQGSAGTAGGTGAGTTFALQTHTHTFAAASATHTTNTTVKSESASGSGTSEPAYYKLNVIQNGTGGDDLPNGVIGVWIGTLANIPTGSGWSLCDGNNGTPSIFGKHIKGCNANGELGNTGGSNTHTHTNPGTHVHNVDDGSSEHTPTVGAPSTTQATATSGASSNVATSGHTDHSGPTDAASATDTGTGTAGTYNTPNSEPAYVEVAFVQFNMVQRPPVLTRIARALGAVAMAAILAPSPVNLLTTTLSAPPAPKPFSQTNWPVPQGPQHPIANRTHIVSSAFHMLRDVFFGVAGHPNTDFPNPQPLRRAQQVGFEQNLQQTTLAQPIKPVDQPNPQVRRVQQPSFEQNLQGTTLKPSASTAVFGGNYQPLARWKQSQISFGTAAPEQPVIAAPFNQTDWPNPRGHRPRQDFIKGQYPVGQDAGLPRTYDQPNPTVPRKVQQPQFEQNLLGTALVPAPTGTPFVQSNWPNPRGPSGVFRATANIYHRPADLPPPPVTPKPFPPSDFPNPPRKTYDVTVHSLQVRLPAEETQQVFTYSWPVPQGRAYPASLRTWTNGDLLTTTLSAPAPKPFAQNDWPNPRGYRPRQDFVKGQYPTGQDAGLPRTYDQPNYSNPRGPQYPVELRTWTHSVTPYLPTPATTAVTGSAYQPVARWKHSRILFGTAAPEFVFVQSPLNQSDFPNPLVRRVQQPRFELNLLKTTLAPTNPIIIGDSYRPRADYSQWWSALAVSDGNAFPPSSPLWGDFYNPFPGLPQRYFFKWHTEPRNDNPVFDTKAVLWGDFYNAFAPARSLRGFKSSRISAAGMGAGSEFEQAGPGGGQFRKIITVHHVHRTTDIRG